jgi:hypothetical protein
MFWKLDLFLSSGEGRKTPTLLGPLEKANLNHWTIFILFVKMYVLIYTKFANGFSFVEKESYPIRCLSVNFSILK